MSDGADGHVHNTDGFFDSLLKPNEGSNEESGYDETLQSDEQLSDEYSEEERRYRSQSISSILEQYELAYSDKVSFQRTYRKILFWGCSAVVLLFIFSIIGVLFYAFARKDELAISSAISVVTVIVTFVVSVLELVKIIMNYCFPDNDDEYIVQIISSIQENDLESVKELNRSIEAKQSKGRK